MNRYTLLGYAVFSVVLIGAGGIYSDEPFSFGAFISDALIVFASLAVFLSLLRGRFSVPVQIFIGMLAGIVMGWALQAAGKTDLVTDYLGIFGELFLILLKMVIVPLVFASVLLGVADLGDLRKLGRLGWKTLAYFISMTSVAVIIGLVCVNTIRPGRGLEDLRAQLVTETADAAKGEEAGASEDVAPPSTGWAIRKTVLPSIMQSPIRIDEYGVPILAIITFAILLGAAFTANVEKSLPAIRVFQAIDAAMITLVWWIMNLAPLGVFALMAEAVATLGIDYIFDLAAYVGTVVLGLVIHFAFLTGFVVPVLGGIPTRRYLKGMAPALQVAFSTSSSSATLPVNIECATQRVGINRDVVRFVLPLGATVNMDGTALYTAVAALFVAQVYGIPMTFADQLIVSLTSIAVSIGAAGIPGSGLAMMTIIFTAVGIPLEGIGLIAGVDRILDMCRTTVNVIGDSVGAAVVSRSEGVSTRLEARSS